MAAGYHDPGMYYRFDRQARQMRPLLSVREQLDGVPLASVKSIDYPAQDGTRIPAYITFPPGKDSAKGLPSIVMPHGGPGTRDVGGFHWLAQFFAHQGYVVLQPNFRGSAGYGDAWFEHNGFQSWKIAIGDVTKRPTLAWRAGEASRHYRTQHEERRSFRCQQIRGGHPGR
jgi:dipeptidyl aminopeptidase/acylaminoacyl peptidase